MCGKSYLDGIDDFIEEELRFSDVVCDLIEMLFLA